MNRSTSATSKFALLFGLSAILVGSVASASKTVSGLDKSSLGVWSNVTFDDFCHISQETRPETIRQLNLKLAALKQRMETLDQYSQNASDSSLLTKAADFAGFLSVEKRGSGYARKIDAQVSACLSVDQGLAALQREVDKLLKHPSLKDFDISRFDATQDMTLTGLRKIAQIKHYTQLATTLIGESLRPGAARDIMVAKYPIRNALPNACYDKSIFPIVWGHNELLDLNRLYMPSIRAQVREFGGLIYGADDIQSRALVADRTAPRPFKNTTINYSDEGTRPCAVAIQAILARTADIQNRGDGDVKIQLLSRDLSPGTGSVEIWFTPLN